MWKIFKIMLKTTFDISLINIKALCSVIFKIDLTNFWILANLKFVKAAIVVCGVIYLPLISSFTVGAFAIFGPALLACLYFKYLEMEHLSTEDY